MALSLQDISIYSALSDTLATGPEPPLDYPLETPLIQHNARE